MKKIISAICAAAILIGILATCTLSAFAATSQRWFADKEPVTDGFYPTNGKELGREVKVGEGLANVPEVVKRLREVGYQGNYIIEREITGEQQTKDILDTLEYLKNIID